MIQSITKKSSSFNAFQIRTVNEIPESPSQSSQGVTGNESDCTIERLLTLEGVKNCLPDFLKGRMLGNEAHILC